MTPDDVKKAQDLIGTHRKQCDLWRVHREVHNDITDGSASSFNPLKITAAERPAVRALIETIMSARLDVIDAELRALGVDPPPRPDPREYDGVPDRIAPEPRSRRPRIV